MADSSTRDQFCRLPVCSHSPPCQAMCYFNRIIGRVPFQHSLNKYNLCASSKYYIAILLFIILSPTLIIHACLACLQNEIIEPARQNIPLGCMKNNESSSK